MALNHGEKGKEIGSEIRSKIKKEKAYYLLRLGPANTEAFRNQLSNWDSGRNQEIEAAKKGVKFQPFLDRKGLRNSGNCFLGQGACPEVPDVGKVPARKRSTKDE